MAACYWSDTYCSLTSRDLEKLPQEVVETLRYGSNAEYLNTLAQLALDANWTEVIFARYQPLFVDFSARWRQEAETSPSTALRSVKALSRVLPYAKHLSATVQDIAFRKRFGMFSELGTAANPTSISEISPPILIDILLIYLRLLDIDSHGFASLVSPVQLNVLLSHQTLLIRYLACKAFCCFMHLPERVSIELTSRYAWEAMCPGAAQPCLQADWEGKTIDYRFLELWESKRLQTLLDILPNAQREAPIADKSIARIIQEADLSPLTLAFGGYLATRPLGIRLEDSSLVPAKTYLSNFQNIAQAICESQAILVYGPSGSGKTALVREVARKLGRYSDMLTLHLNEQTDAKTLIGIYTSSVETGSFKLQPGVLATAIIDGRWILIEDLDRAPPEVVSMLLPLLDRQELIVPNMGGAVRAAPGFKIIATIRSTRTSKWSEDRYGSAMLGYRFWSKIELAAYTMTDLGMIIDGSFPLLCSYRPKFLRTFEHLMRYSQNASLKLVNERAVGLQDLLRFCTRVSRLLERVGIDESGAPISDMIHDEIFLDAVDCFSSAFSDASLKTGISQIIAQGLQFPPSRVLYCLNQRPLDYLLDSKSLKLGRAYIKRCKMVTKARSTHRAGQNGPFATTHHALRTMESIAAAVNAQEPCLLVGETGIGKTSMLQELAQLLGRKLLVINLSQQSEAGDLLGGFKPVNLRSLAVPIQDEFNILFERDSQSTQNERYMKSVNRAYRNEDWGRLLNRWEMAIKKIDAQTTKINEGNPSKKRKVEPMRHQKLKTKWDQFSIQVDLFRKHLQSGDKGFAFSFIEGNLVKAVRNGDWVLLDEINLASPDTLESLTDLLVTGLSDSPSLLLAESGEIQRTVAHPEFRIFGAMNPATDVGKKNLPLGIRSRFTEIFVTSPEVDRGSLFQIINAYLGSYETKDVRLSKDVMELYLEIRAFEATNQLVDGASQRPHFTLRTLTRTLMYAVDIASIYSIRRALLEGFSMSFLTSLDPSSASLVNELIFKHLSAGQKHFRVTLRQVPRCPGSSDEFIQFHHYWMRRGPFSTEESRGYIITPFVEANLLNLVRATSTRRYPILLQGPTSSGKTSMVEYLAKISGNKFVRINNHEHTDLQEYLGTYISDHMGIHFQEGALVRAVREGHWLVLDELNLAPTDILEALNRLLDDNRELFLPETQEIVRPHENFMLFATQNPPGLYGGRKVLSRAFRNRFLELHFNDIPQGELETILSQRSQQAPSRCGRIVEVYKKLAVLRQSDRVFEQKNSFATLRDLFRWAFRKADKDMELAVNGFMLLAERVRDPREREDVRNVIEETMLKSVNRLQHGNLNVRLEDEYIYNYQALKRMGVHLDGPIAQSVVLTRSLVRVLLLVLKALETREPVLLVGETGCGKTTVCQMVAEFLGTQVHILNVHQNTETGDLIGAQRPIRNKQQIEISLLENLQVLTRYLEIEYRDQTPELKDLLSLYESLSEPEKQLLPSELRNTIEKDKRRMNALFEWSDGALVHAMKSGQHFLLDEISLADDSVLERLNSVLEPSRTLFLAEKGSLDAHVVADRGFQFLATMNPGGDYGKRELSPALRNRFTEIWVPPPSDQEDLLTIATSKLGPSLSNLAIPLLKFCHFFETRYSEGSRSFASLRQMLSWIDFLKLDKEVKPISIVHGAAMVYIDALGANPSGKVGTSADALVEERNASLGELSSQFDLDAMGIYYANPKLSVTDTGITIGPFTVERRRTRGTTTIFNLEAPTTMMNALRIVRALQLRKSILIEGDPGVGKTALVTALADLVGVNLTRINLSEQTDIMDLFGSDVPVDDGDVGQFEWRDGPFLQAMQRGEWVLLDEMNLASQSILEGLNACLDHRGQVYIAELDQVFTRHPHFRLFATQNPFSQGGGRKGLPASFVDRFTVTYADALLETDLMTISSRLHPKSFPKTVQRTVKYISKMNKLAKPPSSLPSSGAPWEFNLRDLLRWLSLLGKDGSLLSGARSEELESVLFHTRFRSQDDLDRVISLLGSLSHQTSNLHAYTHILQPQYLQCGFGLLERRPSIPSVVARNRRHDLRAIETISIAIEARWPCLVVGPSGSGKSSIINDLAATCGARVATMPMTMEMDTMDIVGGYEQADQHRNLVQYFAKVTKVLEDLLVQAIQSQKDFSDINEALMLSKTPRLDRNYFLEILSKCAKHSLDVLNLIDEGKYIFQQAKVNSRVRFEWVNSILVDAMERGHWLVLDNANLCSSSVLDRLNALLESSGVLTINEHKHADGSPQVIEPHKDFRIFLTMDPRHGELSRAMRNRCIEVCLPRCQQGFPPSPSLELSSRVSRFQNFALFDWNSMSNDEAICMARVCFEHLSLLDYEILDAWWNEVRHGLLCVEPEKVNTIQVVYEATKRNTTQSLIATSINELYLTASLEIAKQISPTIFASSQSSNPLNNPPLMAQIRKQGNLEKAIQVSTLLDCFQAAAILESRLLALSRTQGVNKTNPTNRLMRSILSNRNKTFSTDSTKNLARFLRGILEAAIAWIGESPLDDTELSTDACTIVGWIEDFLVVSQADPFNDGKFQQYLEVGVELAESLRMSLASANFSATFKKSLRLFDEGWKLARGYGMVKLWELFRPRVPSTLENLQQLLELERCTDQFDELTWKTQSSLQSLLSIRKDLSSTLRQFPSAAEVINRSDTVASSIVLMQAMLGDDVRMEEIKDSQKPLFSEEFECLRQYTRLCNTPSEQQDILDLFSGRRIRDSVQRSESSSGNYLLYQLRESTGIDRKNSELAALSGTLPLSILEKTWDLPNVSLGAVIRIREEIGILQKQIATATALLNEEQIFKLRRLLSEVLKSILEVHADFFERGSLSAWVELLKDFQSNNTIIYEVLEQNPITLKNDSDESAALQRIVIDNFSVATKHLASEGNLQSTSAALAFVNVFLGCLKLYVPNVPHDPAFKSIVAVERWANHKSRLERQLNALQTFEEKLTGMHTNPRCDKIRQHLAEIGAKPSTPSIVRPILSRLQELQELFNMVDRVIVAPAEAMLSSEDEFHPEQAQIIRKSISKILARLADNYREYDDLTMPLVGILHGLDIGLAMLSLPLNQRRMTRFLQQENEAPNILGLDPKELASLAQSQNAIKDLHSFDHRIIGLQFAILQRSVTGMDGILALHTTMLLQGLYQDWKGQLEVARIRETAKSALYRYTGDTGNFDDLEELEDLFPNTSDKPVRVSNTNSKGENEHQAVVQLITELHKMLFYEDTSGDIVVTYLKSFTRSFVQASTQKSGLSVAQNISFLPSAVLQFSEASIRLTEEEAVRQPDFYQGSNLAEASRAAKLAFEIRSKFLDIQRAWPEHATPTEVLEKVANLLELAHSQPLARIIQRAESLHSSVNQWQQIASQQFSVQSLYDQLTELLISWRRLELSSWSRLLDREDKKQEQEVSSWWFIIYEAMFPPSLESKTSHLQTRSYAEMLIVEIQKFLKSSPIGQFEARIKLLVTFAKHAQCLQRSLPAISILAESLNQTVRYFSRWLPENMNRMNKAREELNKKMKDVLLLSSWKDTNISALRSSAQKSHRSLFKVVRTYRELIAQPADTTSLISESIEEANNGSTTCPLHSQSSLRTDDAVEVCGATFPNWPHRAARLQNPSKTALLMSQIGMLPPRELDIEMYLTSFRRNFVESIRALRNETPSKATADNKPQIKHLKARKRHLLAETIKDIRRMGIRQNLDATTVSAQSSIEKILSDLPLAKPLEDSENKFYGFLDQVFAARQAAKKHSEDLTSNEIVRCTGLLEGLAYYLINQRRSLSIMFGDIEVCDSLLCNLEVLYQPGKYSVSPEDSQEICISQYMKRSSWLKALINATRTVIERLETMGGEDFANIKEGLGRRQDQMSSLHDSLVHLPSLPHGLTTTSHSEREKKMDDICSDMHRDLEQWSNQFPSTKFVLQYLKPWLMRNIDIDSLSPLVTSSSSEAIDHLNTSSATGSEFDENLVFDVVDSMLVGVQRLKYSLEDLPSSTDESAWLTREERALNKATLSLHLKDLVSRLDNLLLQRIGNCEGEDLKAACALSAIVLPIIQQYRNSFGGIIANRLANHGSMCHLALTLSRTFNELATKGFCSPQEDFKEQGESGKMEEGVGLGDGRGAENISKSIDDTEDLSELAQEPDKEEQDGNQEEDQFNDELIDLQDDDFEGQISEEGTMSGSEEGEDQGGGEEEDVMSDEVGDVDELDPSTVDEKLWSGEAEDAIKQREGAGKGQKRDEFQAKDDKQAEELETANKDQDSTSELEEDQDHASQERPNIDAEQLEQHVPKENNLDLPDDINMDGTKALDTSSEDGDMQDLSDIEEAAEKASFGSIEEEFESSRSEEPQKRPDKDSLDNQDNLESMTDLEDLDTDRGKGDKLEMQNTLEAIGQDFDISDGPNLTSDSLTQPEGAPNEHLESKNDRQLNGEENKKDDNSEVPKSYGDGEKQSSSFKQIPDRSRDQRRRDEQSNRSDRRPFRKLAEALEKWHRTNQEIQKASGQETQQAGEQAQDTAPNGFEHLENEDEKPDTQALGSASNEEAKPLDHEEQLAQLEQELPGTIEEPGEPEGNSMAGVESFDLSTERQDDDLANSIVRNQQMQAQFATVDEDVDMDASTKASVEEPDNEMSDIETGTLAEIIKSVDEARSLWCSLEEATRSLSLSLTEQLRLTLAPSQATKMRGDYRTGKRLNIKRIIPYIASQYKRDKIWMRRSIPSKRNYQVMVAIDDSKSMDVGGSSRLAFESLVLLSRSLSMLEVGQICIASFGESFKLVHPFEQPFSSESAIKMVRHFNFRQTETNVRNLLSASLEVFRQTRAQQARSGADLWQLQFIISDAFCSDHEHLQRLVRQAYEERIMIIFAIVNAPGRPSVLDTKEASWEQDERGESKLQLRSYLDGFPFLYYLIVRDIQALPSLLSTALRRWFAEVSESA